MSSILAVVKGDRIAAERELAERRIPAEFVRVGGPRGGETHWHVPESCRPVLIRWFCEDPIEPPYPVGTLLYHS